MNVKEKVGILGFRPTSARAEHLHGPPAGSLEATAASGTRAERQAAAMQLWNKWAAEALGPMSADPSPEELNHKSRRVQRLEQDCAAMAARAQRRLEMSAALRSQPIIMGPGSGSAAGGTGRLTADAGAGSGGASTVVLLRTGSFNQETQYAVRERRKAAAYAAARAEGEAEAAASRGAAGGAGTGPAGSPPRAGAGATAAQSFKSRAMLDALIASRAAAANGAAALAATTLDPRGSGAFGSPRPATAGRLRPHSALATRGSGAAAAAAARARPRSAASLATSRQASFSTSVAGVPGSPLPRAGGGASPSASLAAALPPGLIPVPEGEYVGLRQEVAAVSERLAAAQAALEVQADTEGQLRGALDLLRARLHSAGLREVEAQRRLAQHTRLEPLFDRLAEAFTFSSPEEVVARLEFLEDDKLGTFDQLLRTQEEVTRLQQKLAEAQKASETVATRLTTEHLQGSARLQQQNEELRQELEAMENLVQRLTARQAQLVALQTAVLQLWGKLTEDPQFAAAFGDGPADGAPAVTTKAGAAAAAASRRPASAIAAAGRSGSPMRGTAGQDGGEEDAGAPATAAGGGGKVGSGGGGIELSDPLSMLHMIEEFVICKSGKLAIRHFTDIQRVANHVWQQHFRSRADIRGRVVPTFEHLSDMADRMADRVRSVADQASRSREAERTLLAEVRRLQQQKRVLEGELARKDEAFRSIMGVPRRARPASAAAELERVLRRDAAVDAVDAAEAAAAAAAAGRGGVSRAGSMASTSYAASLAASSVAAAAGSVVGVRVGGGSRGRGAGADGDVRRSAAGVGQALSHRARPVSAPSRAAAAAAAAAAARVRQVSLSSSLASGGGAAAAPAVAGGDTLATLLSPAVSSQVPQVTSNMPAGEHWMQHASSIRESAASTAATAQCSAPSRLPAGSLFYLGPPGSTSAAAAAGGSGGGETGGTGSAPHGEGQGGSAADAPSLSEAQASSASPLQQTAAPSGSQAEPQRPPSARWAAPQRSAIEQAFLARLERRTRVS